MSGGALVRVGVVGRPHGLSGDVYVRPEPDVDDAFPPGRRYRAGGRELEVVTSRLHRGRRLVRFAGVVDRTAAEGLRGLVLRLPRSELPLPAGAFWADDVVGMDVVDDRGRWVGVVGGLADGPAHDYVVVERPSAPPALVPAVEELVQVLDDRLVVHAIPGLLDTGEPAPEQSP